MGTKTVLALKSNIAQPFWKTVMSNDTDLDFDTAFENIDFDEIEKKNAERIQEMDESVPEADNDCGDACKI